MNFLNNGFYNRRFDSIQFLRAAAAFSVIFNHMAFIGKGAFGVDIFFCISGFIMMYVTEIDTRNFLMKRIIRLAPLYYFMTIITFIGIIIMPQLFDKTTANPVMLLKTIFFIPYSINGVIQPIVRVGWTLNYEMFFYFIVWISIRISKKYRSVIASFIILVLVVSGKFIDSGNALADFWTDSIIIEFIYGMLAYEIHRKASVYYKNMNVSVRLPVFLLAVCSFSLLWIVDYDKVFFHGFRFIIYGIPAFIIFNCIFIAGYGIKLPSVLVWLGDISYSMYLIHYFIIRLYNRYMCPDGVLDGRAVFGAIAATVAVICAGAVSYALFEKKLNIYLRNKILH